MKRTKMTTFVELFLPLLLVGLLVLLRYLIKAEELPRMEYPEVLMNDRNHFDFYTLMHFPLYRKSRLSKDSKYNWMHRNYEIAGVMPRPFMFYLPKKCYYTGDIINQKQIIAFIPENEYTKYLRD
jgi:hypothetical protein